MYQPWDSPGRKNFSSSCVQRDVLELKLDCLPTLKLFIQNEKRKKGEMTMAKNKKK